MKIPAHLGHLRTDDRGRPVPYINIWGPPDVVDRLTIRYDRTVRDVAVFYADEPTGQPDFTRQSMQRQRESMKLGLCQVCARVVPWHDRKLVLSPVTTHVIDYAGSRMCVVHEPWLCPECAEFAVAVCPSLIRRSRDEYLVIHSISRPDDVQMLASKGWIEGPYEASTRRMPVVMWVKLVLPRDVLDIGSPYAKAGTR